jgi:chromosomal replication initiator protein
VSESLWNRCLRVLESELPEQQFNTWVRPLQPMGRDGELCLLAPNRYVIDWVTQNSLPRIQELLRAFAEGEVPEVVLEVGTRAGAAPDGVAAGTAAANNGTGAKAGAARTARPAALVLGSRINAEFTFDNFVEGKSNQLAKAAALQVAGNPGRPTTRCSSMAASASARRT